MSGIVAFLQKRSQNSKTETLGEKLIHAFNAAEKISDPEKRCEAFFTAVQDVMEKASSKFDFIHILQHLEPTEDDEKPLITCFLGILADQSGKKIEMIFDAANSLDTEEYPYAQDIIDAINDMHQSKKARTSKHSICNDDRDDVTLVAGSSSKQRSTDHMHLGRAPMGSFHHGRVPMGGPHHDRVPMGSSHHDRVPMGSSHHDRVPMGSSHDRIQPAQRILGTAMPSYQTNRFEFQPLRAQNNDVQTLSFTGRSNPSMLRNTSSSSILGGSFGGRSSQPDSRSLTLLNPGSRSSALTPYSGGDALAALMDRNGEFNSSHPMVGSLARALVPHFKDHVQAQVDDSAQQLREEFRDSLSSQNAELKHTLDQILTRLPVPGSQPPARARSTKASKAEDESWFKPKNLDQYELKDFIPKTSWRCLPARHAADEKDGTTTALDFVTKKVLECPKTGAVQTEFAEWFEHTYGSPESKKGTKSSSFSPYVSPTGSRAPSPVNKRKREDGPDPTPIDEREKLRQVFDDS